MSNVRIRTAAVVAVLSLALPSLAHAGTAKDVISGTLDSVVVVLSDDSLSDAQQLDKIADITRSRFDFTRMSKLVLGRHYKKLSDAQRSSFTAEFERHMSITYGKQLSGYTSDTEIVITDTRAEKNKDETVMTKIVGGAADGILINYRLRETDGQWRVIDVIIENVSLISNFRSQVQELFSSKGADGLIDSLKKKNDAAAAKTA